MTKELLANPWLGPLIAALIAVPLALLAHRLGGLVLERVSGERGEDFFQTHILLPLGMERATTSLEDMFARLGAQALADLRDFFEIRQR